MPKKFEKSRCLLLRNEREGREMDFLKGLQKNHSQHKVTVIHRVI